MRVTPEQSKRVQEICFENGVKWNIALNKISHINKPYLAIEPTIIFYKSTEVEYSSISSLFQEIDAELFIRTNGTCKEKISEKIMKENTENLETFINKNNCENISDLKRIIVLTANKHDILERKLKKKNEILKKARIKRKNQREELHKLNLKLQKCISLEEHNIRTEKLRDTIVSLRDDVINKVDNITYNKNKEIEKLKAVIEYLESKVK